MNKKRFDVGSVFFTISALSFSACGGTSNALSDNGTAQSTDDAGDTGTLTPTIRVSVDKVTPMGEMALGINYWSWVDAWGNSVAGTEEVISALRPRFIRIGGTNNDTGDPEPFDSEELDDAIDYARSIGAEPMLQVPFLYDENGDAATAENAADIVRYANITNDYQIRYFTIGNEPDIYIDQEEKDSDFTVEMFCDSFKGFAQAMKAVDPDILIVGPELSWRYQSGSNDWLTPFLTQCGDEVDIVSIHRYPIDPSKTTISEALNDVNDFRESIDSLLSKMAEAGKEDAPLAITETNISWDGDPENSPLEASPGTFFAGLWAADTFGAALEMGVWTYAFWSISEGWTLGFLDGDTPRPVYYMIKMYADHFGENTVAVSEAPDGFSVYAGRTADDDGTVLMVLNKTDTASEQIIRIEHSDTPIDTVVQDFPEYSISAVIVPDHGEPSVFTYAAADPDVGPQQVR